MGSICWFTNLDIEKRHENMTLFRYYAPEAYPKNDNYDAIGVSREVVDDYLDSVEGGVAIACHVY